MEVALPTNEPAIHRLVDDILEYIFLLNATPPPKWSRQVTDSNDQPTVEHATTVASSQVCTRWRSIAFNCHAIWGLIIDYPRHSLRWIETLLDRSNPSLLDFGRRFESIYLDDGRQGVLELVFNHIDRFRIFSAQIPTSSWERFFNLPAPNLEIIRASFDFSAGHLTHPLFYNHAPNLRIFRLSLRTSFCVVDLTSPVFTNLNELCVDNSQESGLFTILDWLNIFGGMPSLRKVELYGAISPGSPNDNFPFIHLDALDMLMVIAPLHECVTLVKHLIVPPRCGLNLRCDPAHAGFDQQQLWAIIERKITSWAKNDRLYVEATINTLRIGNIPREDDGWESKEADPKMSISLYLSDLEETFLLFRSLFALFEPTFFDTRSLRLCVNIVIAESFTGSSLVDNFGGFVNLEKLEVWSDSLCTHLLSLLQHANPVLLPRLKSLYFNELSELDSILRIADFLQWRRERGFPLQKINIIRHSRRIDREYILSHIQDTVVEIGECY